MNKINFTETNPQFVGYAGIRFLGLKKMVNEKVICGKCSFFVTEVPILARCHSQMGGFLSKKTEIY